MTKNGLSIIFIACIFLVFYLNLVSSEIILNEKLNGVYNVGNSIKIPLTIKVLEDTSGILQLDLICDNGTQINFYKNGICLSSGEETTLNPILVLIPNIIGENKGNCKIKASINEDFLLTDEFKISDLLIIQSTLEKNNFNPGEDVIISGTVKKEDETPLNGFIDFVLKDNDKEILKQSSTVNKGNFNSKITLPEDIEAKDYTIFLTAYEKNKAGITLNKGESNLTLSVNQIPKRLSILLNKDKIKPEETLVITSTLYDQTGKTISSLGNISILDKNNNIIEKKEINTDSELEYKIRKMELPSNWSVKSQFNGLEEIKKFEIEEQENLEIQLENQTLFITNYGNIPYNKTLSLEIGDKPLELNVSLDIGESKKYKISAPKGEYNVKIYTGEDTEINKKMSLTGNAIRVTEDQNNSFKYYIIGFLIIIFLLIIMIKIRKHNKRKKIKMKTRRENLNRNTEQKKERKFKFLRRKDKNQELKNAIVLKRDLKIKNSNQISPNQEERDKEFVPIEIYEAKKEKQEKEYLDFSKENMINRANKAEMFLSLQGEPQESAILCLKIKDLEYYFSSKTSIHDTLLKILQIAEVKKGVYYINKDYLFLIFSPLKTKTMRNEEIALNTGEEILNLLNEHNKKFLQKINFGISLNKSKIVTRIVDNIFKFMVLDSSMTQSKKISSLSNNEFLLSQEINNEMLEKTNYTKEIREGNVVYVLTSLKKEDDKTKKFIERFLKRQQES
jgi:hypothetical protein